MNVIFGIFFFLHDDTQNYAATNLEMTVNVFFSAYDL